MKPLPVFQEAFKVALAMTIAYGVSLHMNWENPKWAAFAVAFISLSTVGQSLNKALLRMAGTLLGAVVALTLIGLFVQDRWLFALSVSLWMGLCAYMNAGPRNQYFWFVAGFVVIIITGSSSAEPGSAFLTALLRTQQTGLGIVAYSLVALLLWPRHSRQQLQAAATDLANTQRELLPATLRVLRGELDASSVMPLYEKQKTQTAQLVVQLEFASADSDEVRAAAGLWLHYRDAAQHLAESMRHWYESFDDLSIETVQKIAPVLDSVADEFDRRLATISAMLGDGQSDSERVTFDLSLAVAELDNLRGFERTALQCFIGYLADIDRYSRELCGCLCADRGYSDDTKPARVPDSSPHLKRFILDRDRLQIAIKVMLAIWLAFLAVIYIPAFPGGFGFLSIVGPFALIILCNPQVPIKMLYKPLGQSLFWGSLLYLFVMPHLSSFVGLGLMIFLAVFLLRYTYSAPADQLKGTIGVAIFIVMIAVSNDNQTFSLLVVANTVLMIVFMFVLLNIAASSFHPPVAQQVFLRMMERYLRSAQYLLRQATLDRAGTELSRRDQYHLREVAALPGKMQTWLGKISEAEMGAEALRPTPDMLAVVSSLSYRLPELFQTRPDITTPAIIEALDDWLAAHATAFGLLSQQPAALDEGTCTRIAETQQDLENRLVEALGRTDESSMMPVERQQAYKLMCTCRVISRNLLAFAQACADVDWQPWYEERFA